MKQWVGSIQLMRMQFIALFTPEYGLDGPQIPVYFIYPHEDNVYNLVNKESWVVVVLGDYLTSLFKTNQVFMV